jgi:anthranilate synthase/aminodeoxychorismate synthase-like glutamine amidotransferase
MILLVDNYDSFTYNLYQLLCELGADVRVRRNDRIEPAEALRMKPEGLVLSPGPGRPEEAGNLLGIVSAALGKIPLLGVCLGHQALGQALGGRVVRAPRPMHGKVSPVRHRRKGVFRGLPDPFPAARYHSLVVERRSLPSCLEATAWTDDGLVMGMRHRRFSAEGVQFHPESVATKDGRTLVANFLRGLR